MTLAAQMKRNLSSALTDRLPSPAIWSDCPFLSIMEGTRAGYMLIDDFAAHCPNTDAGLYEGAGESPGLGYLFYGDTGVTSKAQAGVVGGVLEVAGNNADNDEFVMSGGSPAFNVSDTAADAKKLWFEARVKKASVANNACAMFLGLAWDHTAGVSVAQTLCLTDDDAALGDFSFLGFHVDQANGDAIDFVYQADAGAQTVLIAGVDVPVIDTWAKLGFVYDPNESDSQQLKIYVDNVEQSTYVTAALIAAATFPDAEPMAPVWCAKVGAAAESKAQIDWWRCVQLG